MTNSASLPHVLPKTEVTKENVALAIDVYNQLLEVPVTQRATFVPTGAGETAIQLDTSHRSLSQLNKRPASQTLTLSPTNAVISTSPLAFTSPDVVHTSPSPSGHRTAVFRSNSGKDSDKKLSLEIWDALAGVKDAELELGKRHGDFALDEVFGPPSWHPDGHALVYSAEALPPTPSTPSAASFAYVPDFGEKFTGKKAPEVYLVVLPESPYQIAKKKGEAEPTVPTVHRLTDDKTLSGVAFGQAIFLPSAEASVPRILATGYKQLGDGRRLGPVYCQNRPAAIYEFELTQVAAEADAAAKGDATDVWKVAKAIRQSPDGRSARSPRLFTPSGGAHVASIVVFLSNEEGGPHAGCAQLHAVSLKSGNTAILVPQVSTPPTLASFPGLFVDQLPQKAFVVLGGVPHVVLASLWRSRRVPLAISLADGSVKSLAPWPTPSADPVLPYLGQQDALKSISVLGTDGGTRVVGLRSGPLAPPELVLVDLSLKEVEWKVLRSPKLSAKVSNAIKSLDYTVLPLPKFSASEIILLSPITIDPAADAKPSLPPLLTIPHGGPHSGYSTDFVAQYFAYTIAGYRVALVNYPGSLGFGHDFVLSLAPELGKLDVNATLATSHYLNTLSLASRTKGSRLLMGGSHGGFISCHLSGSHPDEYDAVVLRNPVTDLPSMLGSTDIPDWTYVEAALPYSLSKPPASLTPQIYEHLHSRSPSANVANVKVPSLLLVGEADRRVPPDQARNWYHALKGQGTTVEMYRFPGNGHSLDSTVDTEIVTFETGLRFLERYTVF